jgi:hypothetical protein
MTAGLAELWASPLVPSEARYAEAARALADTPIVRRAFQKHTKTPPIFIRHRSDQSHWSGWSITFRKPNADDIPDAPPLLWFLKHADGAIEQQSTQASTIWGKVGNYSLDVDGTIKGHMLAMPEPRAHLASLDLTCACVRRILKDLKVDDLMLAIAANLSKPQPTDIEHRLFVTLPL